MDLDTAATRLPRAIRDPNACTSGGFRYLFRCATRSPFVRKVFDPSSMIIQEPIQPFFIHHGSLFQLSCSISASNDRETLMKSSGQSRGSEYCRPQRLGRLLFGIHQPTRDSLIGGAVRSVPRETGQDLFSQPVIPRAVMAYCVERCQFLAHIHPGGYSGVRNPVFVRRSLLEEFLCLLNIHCHRGRAGGFPVRGMRSQVANPDRKLALASTRRPMVPAPPASATTGR
jgi:hypothetical protein